MNRRIFFARISSLMVVSLILVACGRHQSTPLTPTATPLPVPTTTPSGPDYWPTKGWRTTTPEEQGMDSEILVEMFEFIQRWSYDIHSVTVIRNGYLVADATIYPFHPGSKHIIHSCTKSITSALIGIAIERGHIESVQQPVLSFFPERTAANLDANKEAMTLEHLLIMAAGLDCRDSTLYGWRGLDQMKKTDDWVQFVLDLPMSEPPGTWFEYCNGASFLLSAIIQETTGVGAYEFAEEHLFGPLGISDVAWPVSPQGINVGWGELRMRPHDMAKIGYLYLNNGRWEDKQIIPSEWIAASTREHITGTLMDGYGYQWWTRNDGVYLALGYAGQFIFVVPELDLVASVTSNLIQNTRVPIQLLDDIIQAARSSTSLPPNPEGVKLLEAKIQELSENTVEPEPVPPFPEIADRVTGKTFIMDPNPFSLQSVSLNFEEEDETLIIMGTSPGETPEDPADPQDWIYVEWTVGLDNIYRFSPGPYEIPLGLKGRWESEDTFIIFVDYIDDARRDRIRFTFQGGQITIQITTEAASGVTSINGRLEE